GRTEIPRGAAPGSSPLRGTPTPQSVSITSRLPFLHGGHRSPPRTPHHLRTSGDPPMTVHRQPGTVITDHTFAVPLDHAHPGGEQIQVYAREVVAAGKEQEQLPWLLFLQGGPGGRSPRPLGRDGW